MSPQQNNALSRNSSVRVWVLGLIIPLGLFGVTKIVLSMAQGSSQEPTEWKVRKVGPKRMGIQAKEPDSLDSERILEDQIPPHLPIKVELRNIKTNSLLRDLEIKVTNEAKKPIYYLELGIVLPDVLSSAGGTLGFPLRYGRTALIKFDSPLQPGDVPLQPGESFVFKIAEKNLDAFDSQAVKGQRPSQFELKRAYLMFHNLNFGDKTGFSMTNGSPEPNVPKERSANGCDQKGGLNDFWSPFSSGTSTGVLGLTLVRANFSPGESPPQSNLCCPASPPAVPCSFFKENTYNCQCGEGHTVTIVGCQDPLGKCADSTRIDSDCPDGQGGLFICVEWYRQACSAYCDVDQEVGIHQVQVVVVWIATITIRTSLGFRLNVQHRHPRLLRRPAAVGTISVRPNSAMRAGFSRLIPNVSASPFPQ